MRWSLMFVLVIALLLSPFTALLPADFESSSAAGAHCCCQAVMDLEAGACPHCAAMKSGRNPASSEGGAAAGGCCDPSGAMCMLCPCCAPAVLLVVDTASLVERPVDRLWGRLAASSFRLVVRADEPRSPVPRLS